MLNENVVYKGKAYRVLHKYDSGYCEIQEINSYTIGNKVELVHYSEITCFNCIKKM